MALSHFKIIYVSLRARKSKIRQHTSIKLSSLPCPFEQTHKKVCQNGSFDEFPLNHILFTTCSSPQSNMFTTYSTCNGSSCYIGNIMHKQLHLLWAQQSFQVHRPPYKTSMCSKSYINSKIHFIAYVTSVAICFNSTSMLV